MHSQYIYYLQELVSRNRFPSVDQFAFQQDIEHFIESHKQSLPLNSGRRLVGYVIDHPVNILDVIRDLLGKSLKECPIWF